MKQLLNIKNVNLYLIFIIFIISINITSAAVPKIEPYVNDFAHLLTQDEITKLNLQADLIEKNTTYEIAIVTVENTGGEDRIQFANKIGDENGVGKKGKDNGIVVLWSIGDDAGGAIATGRYSESIFNDAKVARIGKAARPLFDEGKYYDAFSQILTDIDKELVTSQDGSVTNSTGLNPSTSGTDDSKWIIRIIFIVAVIFFLLRFFDVGDIFSGIAIGSILGGLGGKKSGGGSFGGGSFGGGGSKW